jgi:hypothetical protein
MAPLLDIPIDPLTTLPVQPDSPITNTPFSKAQNPHGYWYTALNRVIVLSSSAQFTTLQSLLYDPWCVGSRSFTSFFRLCFRLTIKDPSPRAQQIVGLGCPKNSRNYLYAIYIILSCFPALARICEGLLLLSHQFGLTWLFTCAIPRLAIALSETATNPFHWLVVF